jgi:hypothetical protein
VLRSRPCPAPPADCRLASGRACPRLGPFQMRGRAATREDFRFSRDGVLGLAAPLGGMGWRVFGAQGYPWGPSALAHGKLTRGIVLDMGFEREPDPRRTGEQRRCYHPLFVFNQFADLERCTLRPGNVHSADGWESVFKPVIVRY